MVTCQVCALVFRPLDDLTLRIMHLASSCVLSSVDAHGMTISLHVFGGFSQLSAMATSVHENGGATACAGKPHPVEQA